MSLRRSRPIIRLKRSVCTRRPLLLHALVLLAGCLLALVACNDSAPFAVPGPFIAAPAAWGGCPEHDDLPVAFPADLPSTPTPAAGALESAFSVTSTGEATVSIPLAVSPGRAGMQPSLSIVYDSSADEGPLGFGFSIAGLSAVTRCPRNIAQDGVIEPVRDRPGDALCLDAKRLIPVDPSSPQPVEFRTFPDTFVKVVADYAEGEGWDASRGPRSLRVFTKAGLIIDYGAADSLPEIASDGLVFAKSGVVRSWQMVRVRDRSGNIIAYSYRNDKDPETGHTVEHVVWRIDYTGHALAPPSRAVVFNYSALPAESTRSLFSRGMALRRSLRLDTIQIFGPNSTLAHEYRLAYETSPTTKRMLLQQVEECAADQVVQNKPCKPPTRFAYKRKDASETRFTKLKTSVKAPESSLASVLMTDMTADGLDDIVMPDANMLGGSEQPITDFVVATNKSAEVTKGFFETLGVAFQEDHFDPPFPLQPEHATPIDYDADGRMDLVLHDVHGQFSNFIVLLAQPNKTFSLRNTKIPNPYPLGASPMLRLTHPDASAHLADVTGDSIADLIQCLFDGVERVWTVRPWTKAVPGWSQSASAIGALQGYPCDTDLHVVDVNSDGKADLLVPELIAQTGEGPILGTEYDALSFTESTGTWTRTPTKLPASRLRTLFLDVNADGLPDAVQEGQQDSRLRSFINTGDGFSGPFLSVTDVLFTLGDNMRFATPFDANADGRQDILIPGSLPGVGPVWSVLQATGSVGDGTFIEFSTQIPVDSLLEFDAQMTLADPRGPRVTDVDGDGAQDLMLPLQGFFTIFRNNLSDEDLLLSFTDGRSPRDPGEPGFVPTVEISYDHLIDLAETTAGSSSVPPEARTYRARDELGGGSCEYPLRCVVGPRRVVSGYTLASGGTTPRHFQAAYRSGRHHRLGRGFLGFGKRIVRDLDTGAGTAEFYENTWFDTGLKAFPDVGLVSATWRWNPTLARDAVAGSSEAPIELQYTQTAHLTQPTLGGRSYFTLPMIQIERREQGTIWTNDLLAVEQYVRDRAQDPAFVMSKTTRMVHHYTWYGDVVEEESWTEGVESDFVVKRTFESDEGEWIISRLKSQTECSTVLGITQCRTAENTYDDAGLVRTERVGATDGDPETERAIKLKRDDFGNITGTTVRDGFGNYRFSCTTFDAEGMFPVAHRNPGGHLALMKVDPIHGVPNAVIDPNGLATRFSYDGSGRKAKELRPDGTSTTFTRARSKDGGPLQNQWRLTLRTTTEGGQDQTTEFDAQGRTVRTWSQGVQAGAQAPPRITEAIAFDELGQYVERRLVPASEKAHPDSVPWDVWKYDSAGRPLKHISAWGAVTTYRYEGRLVTISGPDGAVTRISNDQLGRPKFIFDPEGGVTEYIYGPFGGLRIVKDPGGAVTVMERDAFGRVRRLVDPDRGITVNHFDGFGQKTSSTDAAGRHVSYWYDPLGRRVSQEDPDGTTSWKWDTAPNGIGKLAEVTSPDGHKVTYTYDPFGRPQTTKRSIDGEVFTTTTSYDAFGRLAKITYPDSGIGAPFEVERTYDPHGHLLTVQDAATDKLYWQLLATDSAGRITLEKLGGIAATNRTYFDSKNRVKTIVTKAGGVTLQDLSYEYDKRLNLLHRADARQGKTEYFWYDELDRLIGSSFSPDVRASTYAYAPNGNILSMPDVGSYTYDPAHPHAVATAGGASYGYDAVGNQVVRPGATIEYTAFDLPKRFTLDGGAGTIELDYNGNQERIRKSTPQTETIYAGALYERVTNKTTGEVEHRYYVSNNERLVAIVTRRAGAPDEKRFVHVDNLGSVDVVTDSAGGVVERRSYTPFGAPRNPNWGGPPIVLAPKMTRGFTGHEADAELGLVNMRGRLLDPRIGRFLTPDPVVSKPNFGQSWNSYSLTLNNPLAYVDPSGFTEEPASADSEDAGWAVISGGRYMNVVEGRLDSVTEDVTIVVPPEAHIEEEGEDGGALPPIDVGLAGNSSGYIPRPPPTATETPMTGWDIAAEVGLGILEGIGEFTYKTIEFTGLTIMTLGGYAGWSLAESIWQGYHEDGVLGALNSVNPLYGIAIGAINVYDAIERGDYRAAGHSGATTTIMVVTTVATIAAGAGALAKSAGGKGGLKSGASTPPRNAHLAGKHHPKSSVPFDKDGFPDFSGFVKAEVKIEFTGSRPGDARAANQAAGFTRTPQGYVWHHHQDGIRMQLVPEDIHQATGHTGGFALKK